MGYILQILFWAGHTTSRHRYVPGCIRRQVHDVWALFDGNRQVVHSAAAEPTQNSHMVRCIGGGLTGLSSNGCQCVQFFSGPEHEQYLNENSCFGFGADRYPFLNGTVKCTFGVVQRRNPSTHLEEIGVLCFNGRWGQEGLLDQKCRGYRMGGGWIF